MNRLTLRPKNTKNFTSIAEQTKKKVLDEIKKGALLTNGGIRTVIDKTQKGKKDEASNAARLMASKLLENIEVKNDPAADLLKQSLNDTIVHCFITFAEFISDLSESFVFRAAVDQLVTDFIKHAQNNGIKEERTQLKDRLAKMLKTSRKGFQDEVDQKVIDALCAILKAPEDANPEEVKTQEHNRKYKLPSTPPASEKKEKKSKEAKNSTNESPGALASLRKRFSTTKKEKTPTQATTSPSSQSSYSRTCKLLLGAILLGGSLFAAWAWSMNKFDFSDLSASANNLRSKIEADRLTAGLIAGVVLTVTAATINVLFRKS